MDLKEFGAYVAQLRKETQEQKLMPEVEKAYVPSEKTKGAEEIEEETAEEKKEKELDGELMKVRPQYMDAIIAYNLEQGKPVYVDANSSLRVTVGHVKGYSPKDGLVAVPFTRLEGIVQKDTGIDPFDAPKKQLELIKQKQYGDFYMKSIDSV